MLLPAYVLVVMFIAVISGYQAGLSMKSQAQSEEVNAALQEQFDLGVEDLLATRYELAAQRFDYVLRVDPNYPGAVELLERSLQALSRPTLTPSLAYSPTPVATSTATIPPTDFEALFTGAQSAALNQDWDGVINILTILRGEDPNYRRQEVNALYFTALRNRGLNKMWSGFQEQGIYDLSLASRLGQLDSQAAGWLRTSAFYLTANSYFGLDWSFATRYFADLCAAGVWDSCVKYAESEWKYADEIYEDDEACDAVPHYKTSIQTGGDKGLGATPTYVAGECATSIAPTPTPTSTGTLLTVTPDLTVSATPSPTASSTTGILTDTPTPSPSPVVDTPTFTPTPTFTASWTFTPTTEP